MTTARARIFGVPVDLLTMAQTVDACARLVEARRPAQHVVINAGKVVLMEHDPVLREYVSGADLVNADGMSVVWAGRLLGVPIPERVAGIDLMENLFERAQSESWPVYLLGAREEVLRTMERVVRDRYPRLLVAGAENGYFAAPVDVADRIRSSGARIVFIAMSSPAKERFVADQAQRMGSILAVGVGGSFDVWTGLTRRAPLWMQRWGLEWFYRLIQEPGRMWRRYLVGNTKFALVVLREMMGSRGKGAV